MASDARYVKSIISKLRRGLIDPEHLPYDLRGDERIIAAEWELGFRYYGERGYDVLSDRFYVYECHKVGNGDPSREIHWYDTFGEYYSALSGSIYKNANYYMWRPSDADLRVGGDGPVRLDLMDRGYAATDSLQDVISRDTPPENSPSTSKPPWREVRRRLDRWLRRMEACASPEAACALLSALDKAARKSDSVMGFSGLFEDLMLARYGEEFWPCLFERLSDDDMGHWSRAISYGVVLGFDVVRERYHPEKGPNSTRYSPATLKIHRSKALQGLNDIEMGLRDGSYRLIRTLGFNDWFGLFYIRPAVVDAANGAPVLNGCPARWFFEFDAFAEAAGGDLSYADFSRWIVDDYPDFSEYKTDDMRMPAVSADMASVAGGRVTSKRYDPVEKMFVVGLELVDSVGKTVVVKSYSTPWFYKFVGFLRGDLSDADLTYCKGLERIVDWSGLKLDGAVLPSGAARAAGLDIDAYAIEPAPVSGGSLSESSMAVLKRQVGILPFEKTCGDKLWPIFYISDIHLMHKLASMGCELEADIRVALFDIAGNILRSAGPARCGRDLLIFAGDICSDLKVFGWFLDALVLAGVSDNCLTPVFIMGNHEVYGFEEWLNVHGEPCESRVDISAAEIYRRIVEARGFIFLHNDLLCIADSGLDGCECAGSAGMWSSFQASVIRERELDAMSADELRQKTTGCRLCVLGGTGFSNGKTDRFRYVGWVEGAYRDFDRLYLKCEEALRGRRLLVATHTPFREWHDLPDGSVVPKGHEGYRHLHEGFIYISGHTHRNEFYDDGLTRLYADNQSGYGCTPMNVKWLYLDTDVDIFDDWPDGIHRISRVEYLDFLRGKNIKANFNRDKEIWMCKKRGYYAFFIENITSWCILNGGNMRRVDGANDINWFFDRMDAVIGMVVEPITKYEAHMRGLSEAVCKMGGSGRIHGCIVDLTYYEHIFVNPFDGSMLFYSAEDMVQKWIYKSVPALLKAKCPDLYKRYMLMSKEQGASALAVVRDPKSDIVTRNGEYYPDTDMYRVNRVVYKMQKLKSGILTVWPDNLPDVPALPDGMDMRLK